MQNNSDNFGPGPARPEKDDGVPPLERLLQIMAALRDPISGCPWDKEQTFATIAPYTIEEAYEVADAIERGDMDGLKDELGDLLLQVVYHARMAEEAGQFTFANVAQAICEKMIRRHPHVFGDAASFPGQWEAIKQAERDAKQTKNNGQSPGMFEGIGAGLPALIRSAKIQRRAARLGFDWPSVEPILDKLDEEVVELRAEIGKQPGEDREERQFEEFGDVMFVLVNLGLRLGIDSEAALRAANSKFIRRMEAMSAAASENGKRLEDMTLDEMQALWDRAKAPENRNMKA
ncbi:MAG: nucleoside triphosphate pyrophosphohydrolase [Rhodomicrobium sp.]